MSSELCCTSRWTAPRDLWVVPGIEKHRGDELGEVQFRYPNDIALPEFKLPESLREEGRPAARETIAMPGAAFGARANAATSPR